MSYIFYFLFWTFILYWSHRAAHKISWIKKIHNRHHVLIDQNFDITTRWYNVFLISHIKEDTYDLWVTEVIPTIIFSLITEQYWILAFYYIWAAFFQETIEHKKNLNLYFLTSGKWHLIHHQTSNKNFGIFFPIWDIIFKTNQSS
jgi:sterol desaturase/sphingolipid hydroxylase (fatty acid hydroxylase superfamily)